MYRPPSISHLFSAAERTGYESEGDRIANQDAMERHAVTIFPGAKDSHEALQMLARHQADRLEAAQRRVETMLEEIREAPMTAPDTDTLAGLLAEATPGPWEAFIDDSGGQWSGWPLSINAASIDDKMVVRTGGQWPYEWDAKTSQHEAVTNARLIALAPDLAAEVVALRAALAVSRAGEEELAGAVKTVLLNADHPGSRCGLNMGENGDDIWIDYQEVDQSVLDGLSAALAAYDARRG